MSIANLRFILDVMVLNDIIEQAAGRQSRDSDHGGKYNELLEINEPIFLVIKLR